MKTDFFSGSPGAGLATGRWWGLAIRGVLAVLFGIIALIWPGITLTALVIVFGVYALINGVSTLFGASRDRVTRERGWLILSGVVSLALGIVVLAWPGITALVLIELIGAWFLITGIVEVVGAIVRRKEIDGEAMMILSGVLSAIFGFILMIFPGAGAISLVWLIGIFAILLGIAMLVLAYRARNTAHPGQRRAHSAAA